MQVGGGICVVGRGAPREQDIGRAGDGVSAISRSRSKKAGKRRQPGHIT